MRVSLAQALAFPSQDLPLQIQPASERCVRQPAKEDAHVKVPCLHVRALGRQLPPHFRPKIRLTDPIALRGWPRCRWREFLIDRGGNSDYDKALQLLGPVS